MIDQAGIRMAQGSTLACERISGVNDNMMKSHYHNYYEIYFLEDGERYHMLQDDMYTMHPGELILFSPIFCTVPMVMRMCHFAGWFCISTETR